MTLPTLVLALLPAADPAGLAPDLRGPIHVRVGGLPLDVQRSGHAAPFVGDFDGDGIPDLLVGQFLDGALRIYPGKGGGSGQREFGHYTWFQAGGKTGRVLSG